MVERLKKQADDGGTFDMYKYIDACTLDMVCREYINSLSMTNIHHNSRESSSGKFEKYLTERIL